MFWRSKKGSRQDSHAEVSRGLYGEIKNALKESVEAGKISTNKPFATPQSCKDVWEVYRQSRNMSFFQLVANEIGWSQDVKRGIHKNQLDTLSALVWLADDDRESFVGLVGLFRLGSEDILAFEKVNVWASDDRNCKAVEEIKTILLTVGRKKRSLYQIKTAIEEAQQIFYPAQIAPIAETSRDLPAGRRLPFLTRDRIYPWGDSREGKIVDRVRIAGGYLPSHSSVKPVVGLPPFLDKIHHRLTKSTGCCQNSGRSETEERENCLD